MSDITSAIDLVPAVDLVPGADAPQLLTPDGPSAVITSVPPSPARSSADPRRTARSQAVERLLTGLDDLVRRHAALPSDERDSRLSAEAERITAEVARQLARARAELGRQPLPPTVVAAI